MRSNKSKEFCQNKQVVLPHLTCSHPVLQIAKCLQTGHFQLVFLIALLGLQLGQLRRLSRFVFDQENRFDPKSHEQQLYGRNWTKLI